MAVGVPEIVPEAPDVPWPCKVRPGGNEPLVTLQVIGVVPPVALMDWLYGPPIVPPGRVVLVMLKGA